jgi:hypothetical protein
MAAVLDGGPQKATKELISFYETRGPKSCKNQAIRYESIRRMNLWIFPEPSFRTSTMSEPILFALVALGMIFPAVEEKIKCFVPYL